MRYISAFCHLCPHPDLVSFNVPSACNQSLRLDWGNALRDYLCLTVFCLNAFFVLSGFLGKMIPDFRREVLLIDIDISRDKNETDTILLFVFLRKGFGSDSVKWPADGAVILGALGVITTLCSCPTIGYNLCNSHHICMQTMCRFLLNEMVAVVYSYDVMLWFQSFMKLEKCWSSLCWSVSVCSWKTYFFAIFLTHFCSYWAEQMQKGLFEFSWVLKRSSSFFVLYSKWFFSILSLIKFID